MPRNRFSDFGSLEFEISGLCRSGSSREKLIKIRIACVIFGGSAGDYKATRVGQLWI